jgi:hypothetical protein
MNATELRQENERLKKLLAEVQHEVIKVIKGSGAYIDESAGTG